MQHLILRVYILFSSTIMAGVGIFPLGGEFLARSKIISVFYKLCYCSFHYTALSHVWRMVCGWMAWSVPGRISPRKKKACGPTSSNTRGFSTPATPYHIIFIIHISRATHLVVRLPKKRQTISTPENQTQRGKKRGDKNMSRVRLGNGGTPPPHPPPLPVSGICSSA